MVHLSIPVGMIIYFVPAIHTNHSVNVSGANNSGGRYYMSVGYTRQEVCLLTNDFNRIQARLNVEQKAKNWLTVAAGY
jgi:hypothetical protein